MTNIYTYPVKSFGILPDPDSVVDYGTDVTEAIAGFYADVETTCAHLDLDTPADLPTEDDLTDAIVSGAGLVYGFGGWLHVIGVE